MTEEQARAGWKFWGLWASANALGWGTGLFASLIAAFMSALVVAFLGGSLRMDEFAGSGGFGAVEEAVISGVAGVTAGAVLGISQWVIIQRLISRARWWVLASALGGAAGWIAVEVVDLGMSPTTYDESQFGLQVGAMAGAIIGTLTSAAQWLVLRRQVRRAGWWVPAGAVAWSVGGAVGWAVGGLGSFVVPGVLAGAITGAALVWLLRQSRDRTSDETLAGASGIEEQAHEQAD